MVDDRAMRTTVMVVLLAMSSACGEASDAGATEATTTATNTTLGGSTSGSNDGDSGADDTSAGATSTAGDTGGATTGTDANDESDDTGEGSTGDTSPPLVPADVIDLGAWKLTLPIGDPREPGEPWEILQPALAEFVDDPHFVLAPGGGVQFRAEIEGVTTSNSGYPRSELREMTADGLDEASWSTTDGVHRMRVRQAITHLPDVKPHVVAGQIHDADDDVVMIRLEGERLFVEGDGDELGLLDDGYVLGDEMIVEIVASSGVIEVFYGDAAVAAVVIERETDGCYFKAGAYVQSNEEQGDVPGAYGEVVISELVVTHERGAR